MSREKLAYETPVVELWDAAELDSIEATMSGGGGISFSYVTIVNNPAFGLGVAGHSALLFNPSSYAPCSLFSFSPYDDSTNNARGAIAHIANSADAGSFDAFRAACRTEYGIDIVNPFRSPWPEKFTRFIQFGVSYGKYQAMLDRASHVASSPPLYEATGSSYETGYNCQAFVNDVLAAGGVAPKTDAGASLLNNIVPNEVMDYASRASGASFMHKDRL